MVPVIETERLRLRGHTLADFEAYALMWADPEVTRHIGGKPYTREESWQRYIRHPGHWALVGHGYWVVEEKESGRYAGEAGFGSFKREIDPPLNEPEHGWAIAPWAQGRGYASEAIAAELAWGKAHFGADKAFVCLIDPDNAPSISVAQKHGYREFARTTYRGTPSVLFRRQPS